MGDLTSGQADLALFPLTLTPERAAAVSYTVPFMSDGYALVVQKHHVSPMRSSGDDCIVTHQAMTVCGTKE